MNNYSLKIKLLSEPMAHYICIFTTDKRFYKYISSIFLSYIVDIENCKEFYTIRIVFDHTSHMKGNANENARNLRGGIFLNLEKNERTYYCTSSSNDMFKAVFREIRDYFDELIRSCRVICLHAACVSNSHNAICIVGDKFSGKTTLMLRMLSEGYDFVSNDKIYVFLTKDKLHVFSLPISAGIRNGSFKFQPELLEHINNNQYSEHVEYSSEGRIHLSPYFLCDYFKVNFNNFAPLEYIYFLKSNYMPSTVIDAMNTNDLMGFERNVLFCNDHAIINKCIMGNKIIFCRDSGQVINELKRSFPIKDS
ncbi:hypothetical protein [Atlantibacter sp.]|uniref:hypothetical protein n=1 Tax=Atlantibacter sp. TaxID=1903473 RepID=UPI0028AB51A2|nr:hypothetical protein [Atlantibacter sp.]